MSAFDDMFLESGSLITTPDGQCLAAQGLYLETNEKLSDYILNPLFNLKDIHLKWGFSKSYNLEKFEVPKSNEFESFIKSPWDCDDSSYKEKFNKIKNSMQTTDLKKIVPYLTYQRLKPKNFNKKILPSLILELLKKTHKDEYVYGFWDQAQGFLGSTPEFLLLKNKNKKYKTLALAGTLPISDSRSMLEDIKLKEEHAFVMSDIDEKLNLKNLKWQTPIEKKYEHLKHIYAEAEFDSTENLSELIQKLSPTSALGVYPKKYYSDFKDVLCPELRKSYGAPFGFVTENWVLILVCLRGLFWDENNVYIHVGGGVTEKSTLVSELDELSLKFKSVQKKFGLVV